MDIKKGIRRKAKTALVCMLTVCMFACGIFIDGPAYAESEFKYSSPFSRVGYSAYRHNGKFTGDLIVNGVDISAWQSKNCDFKTAKKNGVDFAILRVSYSNYARWKKLSIHDDSNFAAQYKAAKADGMMVGIYVFSQATSKSEAVKEATYAVKRLKELGIGPDDINLPVYMDYEFAGGYAGRMYGLKKFDATNAAVAFCNTIKAYGYQPGIYASTSFYNNYIDASRFANDVDIWVAQYYNSCTYSGKYSKWQYSSSARIGGMLSCAGFQGNIDVNFWYLDRKVSSNSPVKIHGRTVLSVNAAKHPKFNIYNGNTLLKEGVDYTVGGIRNNARGRGYAYIKGIGRYGGYALVPLTIAGKSKGSSDKDLSSVAANHLTYASKQRSKYLEPEAAPEYKKGGTYTIQTALNIRKGPGTNYAKVKRSKLSKAMKKKTYDGTYAVLKEGAKVKCKKIRGDWMKIKGGWICTREGNDIYVK